MKPIAVFFRLSVGAGLLLASAAAFAQKPTKAELPPPPGINDPRAGAAQAPPPSSATSTAPSDEAADSDPLAPIAKPDSRLVRDKASRSDSGARGDDAKRIAASQVTRRKQGDDTVEEYRQNGHIWMVKILPLNGPEQTFLANGGSGKLIRDPKAGPVAPVYYSLYEWQ